MRYIALLLTIAAANLAPVLAVETKKNSITLHNHKGEEISAQENTTLANARTFIENKLPRLKKKQEKETQKNYDQVQVKDGSTTITITRGTIRNPRKSLSEIETKFSAPPEEGLVPIKKIVIKSMNSGELDTPYRNMQDVSLKISDRLSGKKIIDVKENNPTHRKRKKIGSLQGSFDKHHFFLPIDTSTIEVAAHYGESVSDIRYVYRNDRTTHQLIKKYNQIEENAPVEKRETIDASKGYGQSSFCVSDDSSKIDIREHPERNQSGKIQLFNPEENTYLVNRIEYLEYDENGQEKVVFTKYIEQDGDLYFDCDDDQEHVLYTWDANTANSKKLKRELIKYFLPGRCSHLFDENGKHIATFAEKNPREPKNSRYIRHRKNTDRPAKPSFLRKTVYSILIPGILYAGVDWYFSGPLKQKAAQIGKPIVQRLTQWATKITRLKGWRRLTGET